MLFNTVMTQGALALTAETVSMLWQVPVLGMLMVFAVLALLWGVLAIFKLVFVGKSPKEQKSPKAPKAPKEKTPAAKAQSEKKTAPAPDELMAVLSAAVAAEQNDAQLVAVLTAAVAAHRAAEGDGGAFRVVSFKRQGKRAWNSK